MLHTKLQHVALFFMESDSYLCPRQKQIIMKNEINSSCGSVRQMLQNLWRSTGRKCATSASMAIMAATMPLLNSCNNVTIHEEVRQENQKVKVNLNVASFGMIPFNDYYGMTKAQADGCCKKIHFALFQNDTREVFETQDLGTTENFGSLQLDLSVGQHQLLIVAHNGDGNPTMTKINSVAFNNKETLKTTDTFYYCQTITISADGTNDFNIALQRAIAAFRITISDDIPSNVVKLAFSSNGGSANLNPVTGWGASKGPHSDEIAVTPGQKVYEIYSFPSSESIEYKITVTAYDARGNNLTETIFDKVPMKKNQITTYTGNLFDGGVKTFMESGIGLTIENTWGSNITYTKPAE